MSLLREQPSPLSHSFIQVTLCPFSVLGSREEFIWLGSLGSPEGIKDPGVPGKAQELFGGGGMGVLKDIQGKGKILEDGCKQSQMGG